MNAGTFNEVEEQRLAKSSLKEGGREGAEYTNRPYKPILEMSAKPWPPRDQKVQRETT